MRPPLPEALLHRPIAHRALHDRAARAPENSMPAVRAAIAAGYGIEIDLQPSADGEAMVFHDDDLDRLTHARGSVRARRTAELQSLRLRDCDEPIPTLAEVLAEVKGRVPLLIEIKDQSGRMGETDGVLEAATARALADYAGPVAVMSFNPFSVGRMATLAPAVPRGQTTYAFPAEDFPNPLTPDQEAARRALAEIADFDRVGASFISHHWRDLTRPRVTALRDQGVPVLCWTIRSPEEEATARKVAHNVTFEGYRA